MSQYIAKFDDGGTLTFGDKKVNKVSLLATANARMDEFLGRLQYTPEETQAFKDAYDNMYQAINNGTMTVNSDGVFVDSTSKLSNRTRSNTLPNFDAYGQAARFINEAAYYTRPVKETPTTVATTGTAATGTTESASRSTAESAGGATAGSDLPELNGQELLNHLLKSVGIYKDNDLAYWQLTGLNFKVKRIAGALDKLNPEKYKFGSDFGSALEYTNTKNLVKQYLNSAAQRGGLNAEDYSSLGAALHISPSDIATLFSLVDANGNPLGGSSENGDEDYEGGENGDDSGLATVEEEQTVAEEAWPIQFSDVEKSRLTAIGLDVVSLVSSFVPVYGTATSLVTGVGSTALNAYADFSNPDISIIDSFKNLGANLSMDVLGAIPYLGMAADVGKVAKSVSSVLALIGGYLIFINTPNIYKSFKKFVDEGADKLTVEDWNNIASGIKGLAMGTNFTKGVYREARKVKRSKAATASGPETTAWKRGHDVSVVEDVDGKLRMLDDADVAEFNKLSTVEDANKFLQDHGYNFQVDGAPGANGFFDKTVKVKTIHDVPEAFAGTDKLGNFFWSDNGTLLTRGRGENALNWGTGMNRAFGLVKIYEGKTSQRPRVTTTTGNTTTASSLHGTAFKDDFKEKWRRMTPDLLTEYVKGLDAEQKAIVREVLESRPESLRMLDESGAFAEPTRATTTTASGEHPLDDARIHADTNRKNSAEVLEWFDGLNESQQLSALDYFKRNNSGIYNSIKNSTEYASLFVNGEPKARPNGVTFGLGNSLAAANPTTPSPAAPSSSIPGRNPGDTFEVHIKGHKAKATVKNDGTLEYELVTGEKVDASGHIVDGPSKGNIIPEVLGLEPAKNHSNIGDLEPFTEHLTGEVVYKDSKTNRLYRVDKDGNIKPSSEQATQNSATNEWSRSFIPEESMMLPANCSNATTLKATESSGKYTLKNPNTSGNSPEGKFIREGDYLFKENSPNAEYKIGKDGTVYKVKENKKVTKLKARDFKLKEVVELNIESEYIPVAGDSRGVTLSDGTKGVLVGDRFYETDASGNAIGKSKYRYDKESGKFSIDLEPKSYDEGVTEVRSRQEAEAKVKAEQERIESENKRIASLKVHSGNKPYSGRDSKNIPFEGTEVTLSDNSGGVIIGDYFFKKEPSGALSKEASYKITEGNFSRAESGVTVDKALGDPTSRLRIESSNFIDLKTTVTLNDGKSYLRIGDKLFLITNGKPADKSSYKVTPEGNLVADNSRRTFAEIQDLWRGRKKPKTSETPASPVTPKSTYALTDTDKANLENLLKNKRFDPSNLVKQLQKIKDPAQKEAMKAHAIEWLEKNRGTQFTKQIKSAKLGGVLKGESGLKPRARWYLTGDDYKKTFYEFFRSNNPNATDEEIALKFLQLLNYLTSLNTDRNLEEVGNQFEDYVENNYSKSSTWNGFKHSLPMMRSNKFGLSFFLWNLNNLNIEPVKNNKGKPTGDIRVTYRSAPGEKLLGQYQGPVTDEILPYIGKLFALTHRNVSEISDAAILDYLLRLLGSKAPKSLIDTEYIDKNNHFIGTNLSIYSHANFMNLAPKTYLDNGAYHTRKGVQLFFTTSTSSSTKAQNSSIPTSTSTNKENLTSSEMQPFNSYRQSTASQGSTQEQSTTASTASQGSTQEQSTTATLANKATEKELTGIVAALTPEPTPENKFNYFGLTPGTIAMQRLFSNIGSNRRVYKDTANALRAPLSTYASVADLYPVTGDVNSRIAAYNLATLTLENAARTATQTADSRRATLTLLIGQQLASAQRLQGDIAYNQGVLQSRAARAEALAKDRQGRQTNADANDQRLAQIEASKGLLKSQLHSANQTSYNTFSEQLENSIRTGLTRSIDLDSRERLARLKLWKDNQSAVHFYETWSRKPENSSKGLSDFLREFPDVYDAYVKVQDTASDNYRDFLRSRNWIFKSGGKVSEGKMAEAARVKAASDREKEFHKNVRDEIKTTAGLIKSLSATTLKLILKALS